MNVLKDIGKAFTPHMPISGRYRLMMVAFQVIVAIALWFALPWAVIPKPHEVIVALGNLITGRALLHELMVSFKTTIEAVAIGSVLSLGLAYLTVLPFFQPIAAFISKMRFLGLVGLTLVFTVVTGGGHSLKLSIMVFCLSVFFVAGMMEVVASVTKEELDHARTLRMSRWRIVWEVVILGKLDQAFEMIRQNTAITWMVLTMVEGLVRAEGGIGAELLIQSKFLRLPEIYAIQLTILTVGLCIDYGIGWLKRAVCPWSQIKLERR